MGELKAASPAPALRALFEAKRHPGVVAAYLFGSHVRRTAHRESDVDVGVLLSYRTYPGRAERGALVVPLIGDIIEATHCNGVDVVILNDAPPELARTIVKAGERLYCVDEQAEHDFARTAQLRYADIRPFLDRTRRLALEVLK